MQAMHEDFSNDTTPQCSDHGPGLLFTSPLIIISRLRLSVYPSPCGFMKNITQQGDQGQAHHHRGCGHGHGTPAGRDCDQDRVECERSGSREGSSSTEFYEAVLQCDSSSLCIERLPVL